MERMQKVIVLHETQTMCEYHRGWGYDVGTVKLDDFKTSLKLAEKLNATHLEFSMNNTDFISYSRFLIIRPENDVELEERIVAEKKMEEDQKMRDLETLKRLLEKYGIPK